MAPERVLLCLRYGIGDAVMELPALRSLREAWPHAQLSLLGAWPALELFQGDPAFHSIHGAQDFGFRHWGDRGSATLRRRFRQWLRSMDFHYILDPVHAVAGIRETLMESGIAWRNSNPRPGRAGPTQPGQGSALIWRAAVTDWGLAENRSEPPAVGLQPRPKHRNAARRRLAQWLGADSRAPLGLVPIASSPLKCWPLQRRLLDRLLDRGHRVVVFGNGSGTGLGTRLNSPRVLPVPPCHLQETAALMAQCRALVSNDTGLMHLAAACGTPTLGLFGPTSPALYLPAGAAAAASERPCPHRLEDTFGPPECVKQGHCLVAAESCVDDLSLERVCRLLEQLLGETSNSLPMGERP